MTDRRRLGLAAALHLVAALVAAADAPPNVLFIAVDDLRPELAGTVRDLETMLLAGWKANGPHP